ncbi:MAG: TetR/AcrR family transcriptional regulator [Candidatus Acidiferrales bacterium]
MLKDSSKTRGAEDRKGELVRIAYKLIASKGFEGFRIRQVAVAAGIDNGTLHYHFPSKQELIRSVVDYLLEKLRTRRIKENDGQTLTGLDQLRREFEDLRVRLGEAQEQLIVMTEVFVHGQRHPDVARVLGRFEESWRDHILAILESGMRDGSFRPDLDAHATTRALMAQLMGIVHQAQLPRAPRFLLTPRSDTPIADILAQVERWVASSESQAEGTKAARPRTKHRFIL